MCVILATSSVSMTDSDSEQTVLFFALYYKAHPNNCRTSPSSNSVMLDKEMVVAHLSKTAGKYPGSWMQ